MQADDTHALEGQSPPEHLVKRSSVRYIRKDLKVYLKKYRFFSSSPLKTKLVDISSRGLQVATTKKIRFKKKLAVNIYFPDGYKFEINGKIVNYKSKNAYIYHLEFETLDNYLDSQSVTFKQIYLFISGKLVKARYRSITSTRVKILTHEKINKKDKLALTFDFSNGEQIERDAVIKSENTINQNYYGIKFDKANHLLGNYLLNTQKTLVFG